MGSLAPGIWRALRLAAGEAEAQGVGSPVALAVAATQRPPWRGVFPRPRRQAPWARAKRQPAAVRAVSWRAETRWDARSLEHRRQRELAPSPPASRKGRIPARARDQHHPPNAPALRTSRNQVRVASRPQAAARGSGPAREGRCGAPCGQVPVPWSGNRYQPGVWPVAPAVVRWLPIGERHSAAAAV